LENITLQICVKASEQIEPLWNVEYYWPIIVPLFLFIWVSDITKIRILSHNLTPSFGVCHCQAGFVTLGPLRNA